MQRPRSEIADGDFYLQVAPRHHDSSRAAQYFQPIPNPVAVYARPTGIESDFLHVLSDRLPRYPRLTLPGCSSVGGGVR